MEEEVEEVERTCEEGWPEGNILLGLPGPETSGPSTWDFF